MLEDSNYCTILYTGHVGCFTPLDENDLPEDHVESYAHGWATTYKNRIVIFADTFQDQLTSLNYDSIIKTTMHELLHNFGLHHCDTTNNCIMNGPNLNAVQNLLTCSVCTDNTNAFKFKLYNMSKEDLS